MNFIKVIALAAMLIFPIAAKADCLVLGDSIAVGISTEMPSCRSISRVGITSQTFSRNMQSDIISNNVVISLGANDTLDNYHSLFSIRSRIVADRVVWVLPLRAKEGSNYSNNILNLVSFFGDSIVNSRPFTNGRDIHPQNRERYSALAREVESKWLTP